MKKLTKQQITKLEVEAENLLAAISDYKRLYERLNVITMALVGQSLSRGRILIVDNFANKNVAFRATGIRRFELKKVA